MSSIIPHHTLIEKRHWNFVSTVPCGLLWDHRRGLRLFWFRYGRKQLHQWTVLMVAIGDYCITCDKILDEWHCPLGVDFAHAVGEMCTSRLHAMFAITDHSPYTCSWNTETCRMSSRASSRATRYHFKNFFLFLHMLLTCSFRWNMNTGTHASNVEHSGKHPTIRNYAHRKPSIVFFNTSSGTTITEAVNIQHIGICEDVRHFAQHYYDVNIHQSQRSTDGVASGSAGLETWRLGATSFDSSKLALRISHNRWQECSQNAVASSQPITDLYS